MSVTFSYADRISFREDLGGRLGDPELRDDSGRVAASARELAEQLRAATCVMFFSGAGLSTACGIPDFRGPNGVWTERARQMERKKGKTAKAKAEASNSTPAKKRQKLMHDPNLLNAPPPESNIASKAPAVPLPFVRPSFTHAFISLLATDSSFGKEVHVTSQNVDGLHLRSGVPRDKLSELHGNVFLEACPKCGTEYVRDFELETVGRRTTGRSCEQEGCRGRLRDTVLDWEQPLPESEGKKSVDFARRAELVVCVGTSLRIVPAADIPFAGKFAVSDWDEQPKKGSIKSGTEVDGTESKDEIAAVKGEPKVDDGTDEASTDVKPEQAMETSNADSKSSIDKDFSSTQPPKPPTVALINLQATPKDPLVDILIRSECDAVFRLVASHLNIRVPDWIRKERFDVTVEWSIVRRKKIDMMDGYVEFSLEGKDGAVALDEVEVTAAFADVEGKSKEASLVAPRSPFSGTLVVKDVAGDATPTISICGQLVHGAADRERRTWEIRMDSDVVQLMQGEGKLEELEKTQGRWRGMVEVVSQMMSYY